MRKRLYKAKRKDNGEWVYGGICYNDNNGEPLICPQYDFSVEVIPETVCEYVKEDCKGNDLYENDIVKFEYIDLDIGTIKAEGIIKWDKDSASYLIYLDYECKYFDLGFHKEIEVIGNIYD